MTDLPVPAVVDTHEKWLGPLTMFVLGFSGMMIGLTIDLQSVLPQTIVSLCTRPHSLGDSIALHAALLPATNILMFASGLVAALFSAWPNCAGSWRGRSIALVPYAACSMAMLLGMFLSEWLAPQIARQFAVAWTLPTMIGAMVIGMAGGMALWAAFTIAADRFSGRAAYSR